MKKLIVYFAAMIALMVVACTEEEMPVEEIIPEVSQTEEPEPEPEPEPVPEPEPEPEPLYSVLYTFSSDTLPRFRTSMLNEDIIDSIVGEGRAEYLLAEHVLGTDVYINILDVDTIIITRYTPKEKDK